MSDTDMLVSKNPKEDVREEIQDQSNAESLRKKRKYEEITQVANTKEKSEGTSEPIESAFVCSRGK